MKPEIGPNRFLCQRCGSCCSPSALSFPVQRSAGICWRNDFGGRRYAILFPFERENFRRKLDLLGFSQDIPIYEFFVDSKGRKVIVNSYMFPKETCDFLDKASHLCSIYERRPLVCRMFPITSADPEKGVCVDNLNCPASRSIFPSLNMNGLVECPKGETFETIFGDYLHYAIFAHVLKQWADILVEILCTLDRVRLIRFKPKDIRHVLTSKEFTKIDINTLYEEMEGRSFADEILSLFRKELERQFGEARNHGFKILRSVDEVVKDISTVLQQ